MGACHKITGVGMLDDLTAFADAHRTVWSAAH
jgi:hypothetical protein